MNRNPVGPPSGSDGGPHNSDPSGGSGDDGFGAPLVVPDDARELERDVEAWRREERWHRRRQFFERLFLTRRWHEHGVSGPLIALILVGVALLGATISVLTPHEVRAPTVPVELRIAAPAAAPGTPGGLLPDAVLSVQNDPGLATATGEVAIRDLRPSVIALAGPQCGCSEALVTLTREAAANALQVYVVGTRAQAGLLDRLVDDTHRPEVHALIDDNLTLVDTYEPHGLTVVPVHADGVTEAVVRDYTGDAPLQSVLAELKQAGPA